MADIIYRYDIDNTHKKDSPLTPEAAIRRLEEGNRLFAGMLDGPADGSTIIHFNAADLGLPGTDGKPPRQTPFAAVLSCADARVPLEMILGQACNDLFVVRVAGNVLGSECLGSLDYAISNMSESLRVIVVLGHSGCGAVNAAVEAFVEPTKYLSFASSHPLRAIVDRLFVAVQSSHQALEAVYGHDVEAKPGYRKALAEVSVTLNAALQAATLQSEFDNKLDRLKVVYGVYDLTSRRVLVTLESEDDLTIELAAPPSSDESFRQLGLLVAGAHRLRQILQ
jgi:carbonic anhydrase